MNNNGLKKIISINYIVTMSSVIPEWLKNKIEKTSNIKSLNDYDLPSSLKINSFNNQQGGASNDIEERQKFKEKIMLEYDIIAEKWQS